MTQSQKSWTGRAAEPWHDEPVSPVVKQNKARLQQVFGSPADLFFREVDAPGGPMVITAYLDGLIDGSRLDRDVLQTLVLESGGPAGTPELPAPGGTALSTLGEVAQQILDGALVLFQEGLTVARAFQIQAYPTRAVTEPEGETSVRGPKEGFIEDLRTNLSLLRRIVRTPNLRLEPMTLGTVTHTKVVLVYLQGLAREQTIAEARSRLQRIDVDSVLDTSTLEELIEDNPWSPFPQLLDTQRPDVVAGHILEGRFAILASGSPTALVAPIGFGVFLQTSEDYYERYWIASLVRLLRFFFASLSLLLPSLYVAVMTYHQELVPTALAMTIARAREGIPFPALIEILLMETSFEALREAGLRLPKAIGQAVSIVGALVIGEAAVRAGIVSAPVVIVVSTTGIASFTMPRFSGAITLRILRFPLLIAAGSLGLYGVTIGLIFLMIHVASLSSFGMPYLSPWSAWSPQGLLDVFLRAPRWQQRRRPQTARRDATARVEYGLGPTGRNGSDM